MDRRDAYIQKFEAQLAAWKADIDKLRAKADGASADAKLELMEQIDRLRAKRDEARDRLDEIRKAGEDSWGDLSERAEKAWGDLSAGIKEAINRFKA
jgi:uncharacterized coiled-coil DUF342 family protein